MSSWTVACLQCALWHSGTPFSCSANEAHLFGLLFLSPPYQSSSYHQRPSSPAIPASSLGRTTGNAVLSFQSQRPWRPLLEVNWHITLHQLPPSRNLLLFWPFFLLPVFSGSTFHRRHFVLSFCPFFPSPFCLTSPPPSPLSPPSTIPSISFITPAAPTAPQDIPTSLSQPRVVDTYPPHPPPPSSTFPYLPRPLFSHLSC